MTADNPGDFPYVPAGEPAESAVRRGYWQIAMGLQQVDGLVPSPYARQLSHEHIEGVRDIEKTGSLLRAYYQARDERAKVEADAAVDEGEREADLVGQRIVELLARGAFTLAPSVLPAIHRQLFQDLDEAIYRPGEFKTEQLVKSELILNGDSVLYADPSMIERALAYAFGEENQCAYDCDFDSAQIDRFARFIARVWQVHPFCEGNTRTVAVFAILYLRDLGFDVSNEPFERHARYFRDALVRANYRNAKARAMPDRSCLCAFFENALCGARHELRSRDLMVGSLFEDPSLLRNVSTAQAIMQ